MNFALIIPLAADLLIKSLQTRNSGTQGKTKGSVNDYYKYFHDGEVKEYQPERSKLLRNHFGVTELLYKQCMDMRQLECDLLIHF